MHASVHLCVNVIAYVISSCLFKYFYFVQFLTLKIYKYYRAYTYRNMCVCTSLCVYVSERAGFVRVLFHVCFSVSVCVCVRCNKQK